MSRPSRCSYVGARPLSLPKASRLFLAVAATWSFATPVTWAQSGTAAPAAAVASQTYDIGAGPLSQVVSRFAAQAGIALTFDAASLQGQQSAGVRGAHTVDSGLAQALNGTNWSAVRAPNGAYALQRSAAPAGAVGATAATLPTVTVTGSADASPATTEGTRSYGTPATSIFKGTQSIRETPQPVTVLTREFLDQRVAPDLVDVLRNTPGITIDYTDSERVNYYSRGHSIDSLQVDGLRTNQGGSEFIQPDTAFLDRIEILRGSAGLLRGSGNPSATVNLVRKRPTKEFQASGELTLGSWNRRRLVGDVSGPLNEEGTLRGRFVALKDQKDFFQDVREEDRTGFYGVIEADLTSSTLLRFSAQHLDLQASGSWGGLPVNFDGTRLDIPREFYLGADWNRWNRFNQQVNTELEHDFGSGWTGKAGVSFMRTRSTGFKQTSASRPAGTTNPYLVNVTGANYEGGGTDQYSIGASANGPLELFGRKHELTVGADINRSRIVNSSGYWGMSPVTIDLRNWDPHTTMPEPFVSATNGSYYQGLVNRTIQQSVYTAGRFSLADPLTAIVGARLTWWDYDVPTSASSAYSIDRELTPYAGLVYDINQNFSAYASYSEIFTPQNAYSADGSLLAPITGKDYEAGIKGEFMGGLLNTSLSLFRIDNEGRATDDANSPSPCLPYYLNGYCKIDGGKTRSEGWELEAVGQLTPRWNVVAGYTNTRTKYLADSNASNLGRPLRSIDPRHLVRVFTSYRMPGALEGLTIGGGVQMQSDTYVRSGNITASQGGMSIWNAMASYEFNRNLQLQLNVNNLFDKVYYTKYATSGFNTYYGEPRNVMLTLRAKY